ncbi:pyruvate-ferredoxin/flavodoxin oxidoreductase [Propionicimonas paludicola]|uniref:Pyruvate-ferredoxin/flavodoxin oxidoreductase n=1 Tax=Propionicimonas paludicola TaxID=185243 RepID=A0A2A9CMH2_9ACTN|nr:2-oxoacid:acceptor oxidoreductase family protein [Propionicimonas paludicola]PFG15604.1 pyruvate-ferredoxin/flavodoxin oxidoreductase [Propionicimonas paludicola]
MSSKTSQYPGVPEVINGNGAVAYVMKHVCGGVIGYPITPSTEISETFEAARAEGQLNVFGKHPFFVETEGEHSAQSGALGAALTGGAFISNASSSQGILYGLESHYVTVGKKIGGFVLQVAARVVTKHSLNVMAGHDDVYALLPTGYTILFGSNPQEAADLAAISYRASALSLVPVANAMDGFATSHVMSEVLLPEPALLRDYLGDPAGRIACPTVAQELLFGAKGRLFQLNAWLDRHGAAFEAKDLTALRGHLAKHADAVEAGDEALLDKTLSWVPADKQGQWRRQWRNAEAKGTRQLVPALVDPNNPGLTGPVQNQPDFQAGAADHRTHFANAVPALVRQAMAEYSALSGRDYAPVQAYGCEDADYVMVGMGSITDDVQAVLPYLRSQGLKVGVVSVKLLQPFPEAELVAAIGNAKAVTVLERSDDTALTRLVTSALFHARANAESGTEQFAGVPALAALPRLTTAIFGLGGHDVQPRHIVAGFQNMVDANPSPVVYLGSQFFTANPTPAVAAIQDRLRAAYPETEAMALATGPNPKVLPEGSLRIRFHSVGGYGTVATGKLLTDLLSSMLRMHSKSAPKYGSEKSGAATNYYITLSPEPVLITNAELEDVEVVVAPDHMVFSHTNPLKGLVAGGTLIMQSDSEPLAVWKSLPAFARRVIRERNIRFLVIDAFKIARSHAPNPELETRMMGIAFIGAILGNVTGIAKAGAEAEMAEEVRAELTRKFGRRGEKVVEANMAVIHDGMTATTVVDYADPSFEAAEAEQLREARPALSALMSPTVGGERTSGLFDPVYFDEMMGRPFRDGTIDEAPVLPGTGMFMPAGSAATKNKGIFRRNVPIFDPAACTACMECAIACPDNAIPNTAHELSELLIAGIDAAGLVESKRTAWLDLVPAWTDAIRARLVANPAASDLAAVASAAAEGLDVPPMWTAQLDQIAAALAAFPVARTRPLFDAAEKTAPGSGVLFSAVVDPWKCTGCLQCVEVCGPGALSTVEQDQPLLAMLENRFERLTTLPDTPERITADATAPGGDVKRILLSRADYYSMTGGHGACRGCGEVTAIHLFNSLSHRIGDDQRKAHTAELEQLLDSLSALSEKLPESSPRRMRVSAAIEQLERRLYLYESGPTGNGPAPTVMANSTGCSSVYASTMPNSPYLDPWVNGLFQDAQPLAVGIYEGLVAGLVDEVRALRVAKLELAGKYDPSVHDAKLATMSWRDFTAEERALVPTVVTISGDGAAFDIGFGAMSRVFAAGTPIKSLVLDTGGYSNTGGQASTASHSGQDADLARYGAAHAGKQERRKELGLLAAFHPNVYVCSTSTAYHGHFLRAAGEMLGYEDGAALMVAYTPCDTENGLPEDLANTRARMAVESRVSPLFVHDPRRGVAMSARFSLEGNPEPSGLWVTTALTYRDERGRVQVLNQPFTPADFAIGEGRFAKQFRWLAAYEEDQAIPIAEYVELPAAQRAARTPFVYTTDRKQRLVKMVCSPAIVAMVEDRRQNWRTLQFLAGQSEAQLSAAHKVELEAWTARYAEAVDARESALDVIAQAMADLATSSGAPAGSPLHLGIGMLSGPAPTPSAPAAPAADGEPPIWLDPEDVAKCNDCATCYQELPQLFEKATIVVDGEPKTVGRLKDGVLDGLDVSSELAARIARVKATCDAEIIS